MGNQSAPRPAFAKATAGGQSEVVTTKASNAIRLNDSEWQENVQKLAAALGAAKSGRVRQEPVLSNAEGGAPGKPGAPRQSEATTVHRPDTDTWAQIRTDVLSPLQEDEDRYYATAVISKDK